MKQIIRQAVPLVACPVCGSATGAHLTSCECKHEDARLNLRDALPVLVIDPKKYHKLPMEAR